MFQKKTVENVKTQFFCLATHFWKSRRFWDNVEKYGRARQAADENGYANAAQCCFYVCISPFVFLSSRLSWIWLYLTYMTFFDFIWPIWVYVTVFVLVVFDCIWPIWPYLSAFDIFDCNWLYLYWLYFIVFN